MIVKIVAQEQCCNKVVASYVPLVTTPATLEMPCAFHVYQEQLRQYLVVRAVLHAHQVIILLYQVPQVARFAPLVRTMT